MGTPDHGEQLPAPHRDSAEQPWMLDGLQYMTGQPPVSSIERHPVYRVGFARDQAERQWDDLPSLWSTAQTYRFFGGDVAEILRFARRRVPVGYAYAISVERHRPQGTGVDLDLLHVSRHGEDAGAL